MTPQQIRDTNRQLHAKLADFRDPDDLRALTETFLCAAVIEIAAQLAELNATMNGIASGLDPLTDADYPRVAVKVRQS